MILSRSLLGTYAKPCAKPARPCERDGIGNATRQRGGQLRPLLLAAHHRHAQTTYPADEDTAVFDEVERLLKVHLSRNKHHKSTLSGCRQRQHTKQGLHKVCQRKRARVPNNRPAAGVAIRKALLRKCKP